MLQITTLGGLTIQRDGEAVTELVTHKAEALLVYLVCTGRPQPREVLAEMFWEERAPERSLGNLRVALTSLRKELDDYLTIQRDTVALNSGAAIRLDVAELEENLGQGQVEAAVALYQGEFLHGFYLRGAPGFDDWATQERERLHLAVVDALRRQVDRDLADGAFRTGIKNARRLLALDPLLEAAHRQLMRLLAYSDQRGAALNQYETCRAVLADELGVEPDEETIALYELIRAGELESPAPAGRGIRGYELRELIGVGGSGQVYRAFQPTVGREVAIKVIPGQSRLSSAQNPQQIVVVPPSFQSLVFDAALGRFLLLEQVQSNMP